MKKRLCTLLMIALALVMAVSCSMNTTTPEETNALASIRFGGSDGSSRELESGYDVESYSNLYWFYTATKADQYGTSGTVSTATPVKTENGTTTPAKGLDATLQGFSLGKWTFTLAAHSDQTPTDDNKVYENTSISATLRDTSTHNIPVSVSPVGKYGKVDVSGAYFAWNTAAGSELPTIRVTLDNPKGNKYTTDITLSSTSTVSDGQYKLGAILTFGENNSPDILEAYYTGTFEAIISDGAGGEITVARYTIPVRVFGHATTTLTGSVTENMFAGISFDPSAEPTIDITTFQPASTSYSVTINSTPSGTESTTVEFTEAGALSTTDTYVISVETISSEAAAGQFEVIKTSSGSDLGTAVAAIDVKLTNTSTGEDIHTLNGSAKITTYIATGLDINSLKIVYVDNNGTPSDTTYTISGCNYSVAS